MITSVGMSTMWLSSSVCIPSAGTLVTLILSVLRIAMTPIGSSLMLMALVELIANAIVLHVSINKMLKSVVVAVNFQGVWDDVFYTIIVASNFNFVNNSKLRRAVTIVAALGHFWKHFIIVSCDQ